jgi:hypothetical protein
VSIIRGRIRPEKEIRQKTITFGKLPENIMQCRCGCERWFDTSGGNLVEIKVQTLEQVLSDKPICGGRGK